MNMRHLVRQASFERRIKHYSKFHHILLVGEGDFSFSSALAKAFGSAKNMVCTSLDSREKILSSYSSVQERLEHLKRCGATVVHGVDATLMNKLEILGRRMFDRIVLNFPHAGFYRNEWDETEIKKRSRLVEMFFKNARTMLNKTGEIHVNLKEGEPYIEWKLVEQAQKCGLDLKKSVEFHIEDYPGCVNKRGAAPKMEKSFHPGESRTYMSILSSAFRNSYHKKKSAAMPKKLEKICSKSHPNSLKAVALQLESVAENARVDLEASFSQLMTLADKALNERDEFRRHRDNALQENENIAKQFAETLKLKEDSTMQRDLSVLELESERKARIDAESERDEMKRQKDEALQEKAKVARQLAETLRLKEDAINQRDMSMLNHKLERQARKAAEKAAHEIAKNQARKAVETEKSYSKGLHRRAWKDKINAPRRKK